VLLEGKKLLVTGVLTPASIAFDSARIAQEQGAQIVLTGVGRGVSLTQKTARRLPDPPDVLEMDVNDPAQVEAVAKELEARWGRVDGLLHAIAFAPEDALGGNFLNTPWDSVATAVQTSAYSLKALAVGMLPLMREAGGAIVSLDFDATVAWPLYDWMGVSKAALESVTRYLARDLGPHRVRVNCVSAGPLRTIAAKGIPGFQALAASWDKRSPLPWDVNDPEPVARAVGFLLSDWARGITGEILHVDGGYHAIGAERPEVALAMEDEAAERSEPAADGAAPSDPS
jgi:enoyl-[acyl-carrier protein] reductase I